MVLEVEVLGVRVVDVGTWGGYLRGNIESFQSLLL